MSAPPRQSNAGPSLVCPVCGRPAMSPASLCSGGFLDEDHPANVPPVVKPKDGDGA